MTIRYSFGLLAILAACGCDNSPPPASPSAKDWGPGLKIQSAFDGLDSLEQGEIALNLEPAADVATASSAVDGAHLYPVQFDAPARAVWIYRDLPGPGEPDDRPEVEKMLGAYGYFPESRAKQIAVNSSRPAADRGTVLEYSFQFTGRDDWMGSYTLLDQGASWGARPGIDIRALLGAGDSDTVVCRFRARGLEGNEVATFQVGGVNTGRLPSSLPFPVTIQGDPIKLTQRFEEYEIRLPARNAGAICDPFCVLVKAAYNDRDAVTVLVDDVRYELVAKE